jgi:hypothetical protein
MSSVKILGTSALAATAVIAGVLLPLSPAGSATSCVAWASLPRQITVHATRPTQVRITLRATSGCTGVSFDNGAIARLKGPGSSPNSTFPLYFSHIGGTDSVTLYAGINRPGTYRIAGGTLRTYDAMSNHIPFTWRTTSMIVN